MHVLSNEAASPIEAGSYYQQLLGVPVFIHLLLCLNEMAHKPSQKDAFAVSQMLRFRSFERQRSLLATLNIQMDFVCALILFRWESSRV